MLNRTFLIAGGNKTSLVWSCPKGKRLKLSSKLLRDVEQVGFVDFAVNKLPRLVMMGDELCINATLALAYSLSGKGQFYASGFNNPIQFTSGKRISTITLPLEYRRIGNIILFDGIGYFCTNTDMKPNKNDLCALAKKYRLPAFGYAVYTNSVLKPYVYVQNVDSFILETACGSGSIATAIMTGVKKIVQLSGETIRVSINSNTLSVSAKVIEEQIWK